MPAFHNALAYPERFGSLYGIKSALFISTYPSNFNIGNVVGDIVSQKQNYDKVDIIPNAHRYKDIDVKIKFHSSSGDPSDWFIDENQFLHRLFDSLGVAHEYYETRDEHHAAMTKERASR